MGWNLWKLDIFIVLIVKYRGINEFMNDNRKPYFSCKMTNAIKGIALVMMFIHHFFTFPSMWTNGIRYPILEKWAPYLCEPTKICVPIFCFITGYTYYFCKNKNLVYSLRKITDLLIVYWGVFFLFLHNWCAVWE